MEKVIIAESKLTSNQFVKFARFDTYKKGKRLKGPLIFMVILLVSAAICSTREGGLLLTIVLSIIGIGLPLVYVLQFELSLKKQCKVLKLDGEKTVYTLRFLQDKVFVKQGDNQIELKWSDFKEAYMNDDCLYLYTNKGNAYLIPDSTSYSLKNIKELIILNNINFK